MRRLALLALAGTALIAGNASAATSPITGNNFTVTATVSPSCVVTGDTDIAFGAYDPAGTNFATDGLANGSINVRCTKGTLIHITLTEGANGTSGDCVAPVRRMRDGTTSNYVAYNILKSAGGAEWGCGAGTSEMTRTAGASNTIESFTTFGVIPAGQDVPAGSYTDTVAYTVTF